MEYIEYIEQPSGILLYRIYAQGAIAEVPERADGKPVRALADHIFAPEASVRFSAASIRRAPLNSDMADSPDDEGAVQGMTKSPDDEDAVQGMTKNPDDEDTAWGTAKRPDDVDAVRAVEKKTAHAQCAGDIEIIRIPEGVEEIGNYSFYGCSNLREVHFPSTLRRIGYGMFSGCRKTERLYFKLAPGETTPYILKEMLESLSNETEVVIQDGDAEKYRLMYPEYYEEGKENTPARIIEIVYHGTGHQYRNCFLNRELQFDKYDEVFPLAAAQESPETVIVLIMDRLRSGPAPSPEAHRRYIDYLQSETELLMRMLLDQKERDPLEDLRVLEKAGYFTSTNIDISIQIASQKKRSEVTAFLSSVRREHFSLKPAHRYEL